LGDAGHGHQLADLLKSNIGFAPCDYCAHALAALFPWTRLKSSL
jgi:hypothetical protein